MDSLYVKRIDIDDLVGYIYIVRVDSIYNTFFNLPCSTYSKFITYINYHPILSYFEPLY
jgi:hypothetical protein